MASPADRNGLNTPEVCWIRGALARVPTACLSVASSALETELSGVTTTRPDVLSMYHEMPSMPD
jgi:hypothetical protein